MYEIFEQLLQKYGFTTYQVSKGTEISQSTFSNWKARRNIINPEYGKKIANFFGVSFSYLMTGKNESENENPYEAKDETERKLLMLCRKAGDVPKDEKDAIIKQFESTIDMYLKAKGIIKE